MKPVLAVVGSMNMDLVARAPRMPIPGETVIGGEFRVVPGGKGANQAVASARLGAQVSFVGRVGELSNTESHVSDLTYQDMTVISGAYWAGIERGWGRVSDYQTAALASEKGLLILIYLGLYE